jgi:hypothetical protein
MIGIGLAVLRLVLPSPTNTQNLRGSENHPPETFLSHITSWRRQQELLPELNYDLGEIPRYNFCFRTQGEKDGACSLPIF